MKKVLIILFVIFYSPLVFGSLKSDIIAHTKQRLEDQTSVYQIEVPIKNQQNRWGKVFEDFSIFEKIGMLTMTENADGTRNYELTEKGKKYLYKNSSMYKTGFRSAKKIFIDLDYKLSAEFQGKKNYSVKFKAKIVVEPWVKEAFEITKNSSSERYQFHNDLFGKLLKKDGAIYDDTYDYIP